jgi:hypothetical protein
VGSFFPEDCLIVTSVVWGGWVGGHEKAACARGNGRLLKALIR